MLQHGAVVVFKLSVVICFVMGSIYEQEKLWKMKNVLVCHNVCMPIFVTEYRFKALDNTCVETINTKKLSKLLKFSSF